MNSRGPLTPTGIYQIIARRGRQCGVTAYPHRFRHHFSHTWLDRGGAERDLMELNGWTSPQMLTRYGASARGARARRSYDRIMEDTPSGLPGPWCAGTCMPGPEGAPVQQCTGATRLVALELGQDGAQVPFTVDQQMVEALSAQRSHIPLCKGIRPRRPDWRFDNPYTVADEHVVE